MKELTENLEKMQSEHKETLFNLKKEEKLKHDQLEAAQVRKVALNWTGQMLSQVYSLKLAEDEDTDNYLSC